MIDKETLLSMYYEDGLSQNEIAGRLRVSRSRVAYYFVKFGIKGRERSFYQIRKPHRISMNSELLDILNGELLGDGCLRR